jgi:hypothetical protein
MTTSALFPSRVPGWALLLLLLLPGWMSAVDDDAVKPSANHGRTGKYHVDIPAPIGYAYWVMVPATYSETNPAGIHVFFHGQSGQGGAEYFENWDAPFLEAYNLIGINMQYMDGDNMKDTAGKAKAAERAIAQTIADYKIVVGRGVICSFSGGGLPHAMLSDTYSKTRGPTWPFCHSAIYSSNYRTDASQGCPMSWFVSVGGDEWSLATLGADGTARAIELYQATRRGACPDIHMMITKGKGHTIIPAEIASSAREFARSDLAFAPFVYYPDYPDHELASVLNACDHGELGAAQAGLKRLAAKTTLAPALRAKVEALQALISTRLDRLVAEGDDLAGNDPILASYYLPIYLQAAHGTTAEAALKKDIAANAKTKGYAAAMQAYSGFVQLFPKLLNGGQNWQPAPDLVPQLTSIAAALPPTSETGGMAAELLALTK